MTEVRVKKDDIGLRFTDTLECEGVDFTTASAVLFLMKHQVSGAAISRAATSSNPAVGSMDVAYTSQAADLATVGKHDCEWQVTFAGGAVHTFPGGSYNVVNVLPDLN